MGLFSKKLIEAASNGSLAHVKELVAKRTNVNETDEKEQTPLSTAVLRGDIEIVKFLLENGANPNLGDTNSTMPLVIASGRGLSILKHTVSNPSRALLGKDSINQKELSIIEAIGEKYPDICKLLIEYGANVNAKTISGESPLLASVKENLTEVVKILIESGANVNNHDDSGSPALSLAKKAGNTEIINLLESVGAKELVTSEFDSKCFIATAAYGSPFSHEVVHLRHFRDSFLVTFQKGRSLVSHYEKISPPFAKYLAPRPWLRFIIRNTILLPLLVVTKIIGLIKGF
jgi:hypothetical protein